MDKLEAEAECNIQAPPEIVWALVSDVTRYPKWGPWRSAKYTTYKGEGNSSQRGPGAVQWLQSSKRYFFRHPISIEKILEVEDNRFLAYTVIGGSIPV